MSVFIELGTEFYSTPGVMDYRHDSFSWIM